MYITTTTKKYKGRCHSQILLREGYREDGKVKNRTIANLTKKPKEQVLAIAAVLKGGAVVDINQQIQGKTIGFSALVLFIMKQLKINKTIDGTYDGKIAQSLIAARIIIQGSRLGALNWAKKTDKILELLDFSQQEKARLNDKISITVWII